MPIEISDSCSFDKCGPVCPLPKFFPQANYVPPRMGTSLRLAIAEAPGEDENAARIPLVGSAGRWAQSMYRQAGVRWDDLTVFNVLPVRPPNNIFPTDAAARSYISEQDAQSVVNHAIEHHLKPLLASRPWERVDLLGDKALVALTGLGGGIFNWRGSPVCLIEEAVPRAVPTLHPAYIARDQSMIPVVINDLKKSVIVPPENYNLQPSSMCLEDFAAREFAFDLETNPATQEINMSGISDRPFYCSVVPFRGSYYQELKRIFSRAKRVIGQNIIQFDLPLLENNGVHLPEDCDVADIMLMHHLLFPDLPHDLEFIASQLTNKPAWKILGKDAPLYWEARCARDVDATIQSHRVLAPMLRQEQLDRLYSLVQVPLARICRLMHETGFKRDPGRLQEVREKMHLEMRQYEGLLPEKLRTHTVQIKRRQRAPEGTLGKSGKPVKYIHVPAEEEIVPWRSSDAVENYLYGELNLPVQLHVKTRKVTSDKTALEKLERKCRRDQISGAASTIAAIRKLRQMNTLLTSFCKEQTEGVGRVFAHFNVHGTSSGRLSSSGPNMQNQPETARYIYVPSHADWQIIQADYSQGENRLAAFFADDTERMARLAQPGFNEHKWTASQLFNIPYEEVVKDNSKDAPYGKAKRVGHGLNYGMGAQKICNLYDLDFREVKKLVEKWKSINARTAEWQARIAKQAEVDGVLKTPFGRKRWFYTQNLYTEALSFLPQSTLADVIFRAMIALMYERINWPLAKVLEAVRTIVPLPQPARLLVQVHDSLVFECPCNLTNDVAALVKSVMEQPWPELGGLSIPVDVEVGAPGASWGEVEPFRPERLAA